MCMKLEIALYGRRVQPLTLRGLEVASRPRPRRDSRRTNSPGLPYSKSYSTRCIKSRRGRLFLHPSRPQRIAADCVSASSRLPNSLRTHSDSPHSHSRRLRSRSALSSCSPSYSSSAARSASPERTAFSKAFSHPVVVRIAASASSLTLLT